MSLTRRLIAAGFADLDKGSRFLAAPELEGVDDEALFAGLACAASPDAALFGLVRLLERRPDLAAVVNAGVDESEALFRVLGASEALGEFMVRHPEAADAALVPLRAEPSAVPADRLRASLLHAVHARVVPNPVAGASGPEAWAALRTAYRRHLVDLAVRDLGAASPTDAMPAVGQELADLAAAALEAALAVARAELAGQYDPQEIAAVRLAVIGMGKCGAGELNYISDVDVIYVIDAPGLDPTLAARIGTALASGIARVINSPAAEPGLWEVDANLRPEGRDGPLVRTLDSHLNYYRRWAQTWEFQALLKARTVAGDLELGRRYEEAVAPLIWSSSEREGFVDSVRAMRRRVTEHIPPAEASRQLKLGTGGLRDVEFTVQLLQLVHGRVDESLRLRSTTAAIAALNEGGYISREDAVDFDAAYRWLRVLEHRIQMTQMRRTHLMPESEEALRALDKAASGSLSRVRPSARRLTEEWMRIRRRVRGLHESIFYRPLLNTAANLSDDEVRLTPEAAQARLAALGYADPKGAMRHIEALTNGVTRRARLQRHLLPVLLGWLADGVDPDAGLLGFRRLSESLGDSHWYLGMLRDSAAAGERLCSILSSSRFITDLLEVSPEAAAWLGTDKDLVPRSFDAQWQEIRAKVARHPEAGEAIRLVRLIRRREMLRIAIADSARLLTQEEVGRALSDADRAAVTGALHIAELEEYRSTPALTDLLVVAMGRQGGREIGYGSDADVLFVHRPHPGADAAAAQAQAERLVTRLSALLQQPVSPAVLAERTLSLDAALRPEGRNGPMVRSLASYREYYQRWSLIWEAQALLRARQMAGNDDLGADFLKMVDPVRYPERLSEEDAREIRRVKARVEAERLPRGADPSRHLKLGRGGLTDVEWLVQLLQLQHAHARPALRTTATLPALDAIEDAGLLPAEDVQTLREAWQLAGRIRSANVIRGGRNPDVLPASRRDLDAVARWCGYAAGQGGVLEEDYLRLTRRARHVFEEHFYG